MFHALNFDANLELLVVVIYAIVCLVYRFLVGWLVMGFYSKNHVNHEIRKAKREHKDT